MNAEQERALAELAARRWRLAILLTVAMLVVYFGFILLVAFDKPFMGTLLAGGRLSVGIVLGALVIVVAPVLTTIYVRWANRHYDGEIVALRRALTAGASARAAAARVPSVEPADLPMPVSSPRAARHEEATP